MSKKEQILADLKEAAEKKMSYMSIYKVYGHSRKVVDKYAKLYNLPFKPGRKGPPRIYDGAFKEFCNTHTMAEIVEKYGINAKAAVYQYGIKHQKKLPTHKAKVYDIITDLKEGVLNQTEIAKKYNVSKQYISQIKFAELKD